MQEGLQELPVSEGSVVRDWTLSNSEFAHFEYLPEVFRKKFLSILELQFSGLIGTASHPDNWIFL